MILVLWREENPVIAGLYLDTLAALRRLKCDKVQGYIIARPIPAEEFGSWLK
jgi:predicted signal transduction protein with EAL and GGDEF domain